MVNAYDFSNPWSGVESGFRFGNALRQNQADLTAGGALAGGDYGTAAHALYTAGDIQGGFKVTNAGQAQQALREKAVDDAQAETVKAWAGAADRLSSLHQQLTSQDPQNATARTLSSFDQMTAQLKAAGASDEDIAEARQHLQKDPLGTLTALGAGAAKQLGYDVRQAPDGTVIAVDKATGKGRIVAMPGGGVPASATSPAPAAPGQPSAAPASTGPVDTDALWAAIKHQESGGQAEPGKAVGPDTPYGNALGSTQMLPATAEAMARKLGIAWNPALMRENSPKALAYQDQLGRAYLQEGLDKNNGDAAAAAAYYYGGPDLSLHGPKTAKYVQDVLKRANPQAYQVAANGTTPPPPSASQGPTVGDDGVIRLGARQQEWVSDGKGALINTKNGDRKKDPTFQGGDDVAADPALVKMLIEGRAPMPPPSKRTDPKWLAALDAATQQDPGFDAANYQTRLKTRQSFLSGKDHANLVSINTLVGHLDALDHNIDELGNLGGFPGSHVLNAGKEWIQHQSGTSDAYKAFEANKEAVVTEATRVFRGASGAEADVQRNLDMLNNANSPSELHRAVKTIAHLMGSRLDSVADSYNTGMGKSEDPMTFLYPAQAKAFARLSGDRDVPEAGASPAGLPGAAPVSPVAGKVRKYNPATGRLE